MTCYSLRFHFHYSFDTKCQWICTRMTIERNKQFHFEWVFRAPDSYAGRRVAYRVKADVRSSIFRNCPTCMFTGPCTTLLHCNVDAKCSLPLALQCFMIRYFLFLYYLAIWFWDFSTMVSRALFILCPIGTGTQDYRFCLFDGMVVCFKLAFPIERDII